MEAKKIHRAWLVCFGLLLMQSGVVGVYVNCNGILFSAIIEDLGFRAGDLSVFYTIRNMVGAAAMSVSATIYFKYRSKAVLTFIGSCSVIALASMAFFSQLWQWYMAATVTGISVGGLMIVLPMILNNWFKEKNGFVIGLVVSFSGIAGAIFSPICSNLIADFGWRITALIMAGICVVLVVLPAIFLVEASPQLVNLLPYGQTKLTQEQPVDSKHPPLYLFIMLVYVAIVANTMVLFANQLSTYAISVGLTLELGALYTSFAMAGNVTAKLILGVMADKIGIYKSMIVMLVSAFSAFAIYWLCADMVHIVYVGSFLFGAMFSITVAAPPLALAQLYGRDNYRSRLSKLQSIAALLSALIGIAIPYSFDLTGTFNAFFLVALISGVLCICAVVVVQRSEKTMAVST